MNNDIYPFKKFTIILVLMALISMSMNNIPLVPAQMGIGVTTLGPMLPHVGIAEVSREAGDNVTYSAILTVTIPPYGGPVVADMFVNCSSGYSSSVDPNRVVFTSPGDYPLVVNVTVPEKALARDDIVVHLKAIITYGEGGANGTRVMTTSARLQVERYFLGNISIDPIKGDDNPQIYNITIKNLGNGNDTFRVEVLDVTEIEKWGLKAKLNKNITRELGPDEEESILLTVTYDTTSWSGKRNITVRTVSLGAQNGSQDFTIVSSVEMVVYSKWDTGEMYEMIGMLIILIALFIPAIWLFRRGYGTRKRKD